jgi:hypothetical protein
VDKAAKARVTKRTAKTFIALAEAGQLPGKVISACSPLFDEIKALSKD